MFGSSSYYNSNPTPTFPRSQSQLASSSVAVYNQQPATSSNSLIQGVAPGSQYAGQMQMSMSGRELQGQQQTQNQMQSINGLVKADPSNMGSTTYFQQPQIQYRPQEVAQQPVQAPPQGTSSGQQSSPLEGDPALFVPLKTARDAVENMMINDESLFGNGLDDHLGAGSMGMGGLARPSLSNLYTHAQGSHIDSNNLATPFVQVSQMGPPNGVIDMLRGRNSSKSKGQGLLLDIGRAYFTASGTLVLWDYTKEGDSGLVRIEHDAGNSVTCVGVVKADPTVFQNLTHLLVIAGNARTSLLGLAYDPSTRSISLVDMLPNQSFLSATSPPNIELEQIVCTPIGSRVFLLGGGCLWELVYEAKIDSNQGWLGLIGYGGGVKEPVMKNWSTGLSGWTNFIPVGSNKKDNLVQLAIDHEREIIYGLTKDNKIERWSIVRKTASSGGNTIVPKQEGAVSPVDLARRLTEGSKFFDQQTKILSIDVITKMESEACLVLTTSSNARIYMKDGAQSRGMGYSYGPGGFHVAHIRLPIESVPVTQGSSPLSITPQPITKSRYMHGVYVTVHHKSTDSCSLVWYTADPFEWADLAAKRQQGQMVAQDIPGRGTGFPESFVTADLQSSVCAIAEEPDFWSSGDRALKRVVKGSSGPELSIKETHEMVTEVTVSSKRRFVVMTEGGAVITFEKNRPIDVLDFLYANGHGRTEMMLAIQRQLSSSVSPLLAIDIAIAAQNGSAGQHGIRTRDYLPNNAAQGALDHLVNWANEQQKQKTLYHQSANAAQWKLDAVYLHLSRSLKTFWNTNVLSTNPSTQMASSSLSIGKLQDLQSRLEDLQALLKSRTNIFSSIDPTFVPNSGATNPNADSFHPVRVLIAQTIEALAFVVLLSEERFETVLASCDPSLQRDLSAMNYFQLVVDPRGRDLAKRLVTNVVNQQISREQSIETISNKLQERCPSYCSRADVDLYKAMESLRKAKEVRQGVERQAHLESALDNFMKACPGLSEEKLNEVVSDFCSLGYPAGCIQLPIEKAERADPDHLAFTYYLDGRKDDDGRKGNYEQRLKFYLLALSAVEKFDNDAAQQGPGSEASSTRDLAYDYALNTGDDLFLMTLYQWMVQKGKSDQLLELENDAKVEAYLRYRGLTSGEPSLLWRFYARRNRHFRAAQALRELAEARIELPMAQRVECLALASMHAKSSTMQDSERAPVDFVTELEETNDVANIQLEIWEAIANDPDVTEEAASKAEQLQGRLIPISELFTDFAEPLGLYESQLTILHASDHRDAQLVADIWNALLLRADHEAEDLSPSQRYRPFQDLVVRLGKRFYPSHAAFPTGVIAQSYYERGYDMKDSPSGWVTGTLIEAGVAHREIWDTLGYLAQDQPPFDDTEGKRYLDSEIAVLLPSWIEAATVGRDQPFFPGVTDYLAVRSKSRDVEQDIRNVFERGSRQIFDLLRNTRTH